MLPTGSGAVSDSLYDRLGGEAAVLAAVSRFYEKVIADEVTSPFFRGLDMDAQTKKQVAFMTWALGGPEEHRGRDLRAAHRPLRERGLSDVHFDRVATHLGDTLRELGVEEALVAEVLGKIGGLRNEVLDR